MAYIELVIKMPEYMFEDIQDRYKHPNKGNGINLLEYVVANGTLLPKGHGKLIDADAFIIEMEDVSKRQKYKELLIDNFLTVEDVFNAVIESLQNEAPTVIEADKAESER